MNRILVDTSVWITFFRGRTAEVTSEVARLLADDLVVTSGPILVELLQGALHEGEMAKILSLMEPVRRIDLLQGEWETAGRLAHRLRKKGHNLPVMDVLLATLAIQNRCSIYTEDKHFQVIATHSDLALHIVPKLETLR